MTTEPKSNPAENKMQPLVKMLIDLGPLVLFFIVDQMSDIFVATGVLVIACAFAFAASWLMARKIPLIATASLVFVLVFGGLTLWLGDAEFIKIEVSVTNALCGVILLVGMAFKKSLLNIAFGDLVDLSDEGWNALSLRLGLFMIAIAIANELVRMSVSDDLWVIFRVYGILVLNALFFVTQIPIIKRHMTDDDEEIANS